jgi:membrane associated rhomboid family serine protease
LGENPASETAGWVGIRAQTERQAMDWSLVLASQGIEAVLDRLADGRGWVLWVAPETQERAWASIRLYRLENRGWAWRRQLAWPGVVFHWGALVWCWVLILLHWVIQGPGPRADQLGAVQSVAVGRGEVWRLVTAVGLHADVGHLAANVATGLVVFGLAMGRFGAGWAMWVGLLSGVVGNAVGWGLRTTPYTGLGASGMVMGGLGMLAGQSMFLVWESRKALRDVASGLLGGFLLFVLVGLNPAADVLAHAGGFVTGVVFGAGLALMPPRWLRNERWDRLAGGVAVVGYAVAWALALGLGRAE